MKTYKITEEQIRQLNLLLNNRQWAKVKENLRELEEIKEEISDAEQDKTKETKV